MCVCENFENLKSHSDSFPLKTGSARCGLFGFAVCALRSAARVLRLLEFCCLRAADGALLRLSAHLCSLGKLLNYCTKLLNEFVSGMGSATYKNWGGGHK